MVRVILSILYDRCLRMYVLFPVVINNFFLLLIVLYNYEYISIDISIHVLLFTHVCMNVYIMYTCMY